MRLLDPVLFRAGRAVDAVGMSNALDPAAELAAHVGHFALHERSGSGEDWLARDRLGVHKLFFAIGHDGKVDASSNILDLLRAGHPIESVFSVPSGRYVRLSVAERRYELVHWGPLAFGSAPNQARPARTLEDHAASIRAALDRTFRMLARRFAGRPMYVTLSGGLDSTTIAALAREHFPKLRTVSFALGGGREVAPGGDLYFARRAALDLGLPHSEVIAGADEVLDLVDDVLVHGQDWRDFNVHCGLVNAVLGKAIGTSHTSGPRPVVLTGDTMNELLADYAPVWLAGQKYYGLPSVDTTRVRRFLVGGLDSGDREVGIFARFGVETVQPYALCAGEYAALPDEWVAGSASKSRLVRAVMKDRIPEYVYARPKVRAQVAVEGEPGGTLALLAERGIDQEHLQRRFAELFGIDARAIRDLVRAGFYRFTTRFPERATENV